MLELLKLNVSKFIIILTTVLLPQIALGCSTYDYITKEFKLYLENNYQGIAKRLYDNAVESTAKLDEECLDKYSITLGDIGIFEPIVFNQNKLHPVKGSWMHRYRVNRCGFDRVYNIYFFANGGNLPKVFAGIMGETNASLQLTNDTLLAVHGIKSKLFPFCKTEEEIEQTFVVFDSKVILFNEEKTKWSEEWDIKACNQRAKVKISFQLDGKGGAYYTLNESEIIKHE